MIPCTVLVVRLLRCRGSCQRDLPEEMSGFLISPAVLAALERSMTEASTVKVRALEFECTIFTRPPEGDPRFGSPLMENYGDVSRARWCTVAGSRWIHPAYGRAELWGPACTSSLIMNLLNAAAVFHLRGGIPIKTDTPGRSMSNSMGRCFSCPSYAPLLVLT